VGYPNFINFLTFKLYKLSNFMNIHTFRLKIINHQSLMSLLSDFLIENTIKKYLKTGIYLP
jgi:hypothetical protein